MGGAEALRGRRSHTDKHVTDNTHLDRQQHINVKTDCASRRLCDSQVTVNNVCFTSFLLLVITPWLKQFWVICSSVTQGGELVESYRAVLG